MGKKDNLLAKANEHLTPADLDAATYDGQALPDDFLAGIRKSQTMAAVKANGVIQYGKFTLTPVGLQAVEDGLTIDEWHAFGEWMQQLENSIQWILGDWAIVAEHYADNWGSRYDDLIDASGYSYSSLTKFKMVASKIDFFRRRKNLSFSHHLEVTHLSEPLQDHYLDLAEKEDLSVRLLRERITFDGYSRNGDKQLGINAPSPTDNSPLEIARELRKNFTSLSNIAQKAYLGTRITGRIRLQAMQDIATLRQYLDDVEETIRRAQ